MQVTQYSPGKSLSLRLSKIILKNLFPKLLLERCEKCRESINWQSRTYGAVFWMGTLNQFWRAIASLLSKISVCGLRSASCMQRWTKTIQKERLLPTVFKYERKLRTLVVAYTRFGFYHVRVQGVFEDTRDNLELIGIKEGRCSWKNAWLRRSKKGKEEGVKRWESYSSCHWRNRPCEEA